MLKELYFYDIFPKVLPQDEEITVHIRALSPHTAFSEDRYLIRVYPMTRDIYSKTRPPVFETVVSPQEGELVFSHAFPGEQEHSVRISPASAPENCLAKLAVYSLAPDLMERRPYMGDFHVHSCRSDGREAPEFVAAFYREQGFDFMALTDHLQRNPSLEAIEKYRSLRLDFQLYPGEEVHTPGNEVHLVNFGGGESVNEQARRFAPGKPFDWNAPAKEDWLRQVQEVQDTLPPLPEGIDPFVHASCLLALQKIRACGGLGIFCHPHWIADVYHVPDVLTCYYLENHIPDAFELLGGQTTRENLMQTSLYQDVCPKEMPVVGSSDSHSTLEDPSFGRYKTLVFAKSNTLEEIIRAVKEQYTAAIDCQGGEEVRLYSSYRMVSYGLFLCRQYLPLHDELCQEEGRLMRRYLGGDPASAAALDALRGQTVRLQEKYFAGSVRK